MRMKSLSVSFLKKPSSAMMESSWWEDKPIAIQHLIKQRSIPGNKGLHKGSLQNRDPCERSGIRSPILKKNKKKKAGAGQAKS